MRLIRLTAVAAVAAAAMPFDAASAVAGRRSVVDSAPLGYFGCFSGTVTSHYFCVAAWETADGLRVVVQGEAGGNVLTRSYVEDVVVAPGALRRVPDGVDLTVDLPRTGRIDLSSRTGRLAPIANNNACASYSLTYDLVGDDGAAVIGGATTDTGTIGGIAVSDLRCNAHIVGATTGSWVLAVVLEEGVLDPS